MLIPEAGICREGLAAVSTILSGDIIPPDGWNPSEEEPNPSSPLGQLVP